jgi:uncharacterized tellurite resistance protein B-like protein
MRGPARKAIRRLALGGWHNSRREAGSDTIIGMLQRLKSLLADRVKAEAADASEAVREHALRLATAALLFEVSRGDGLVRDEERTVMRAAIQSTLGLAAAETEELLSLAEAESRGAASLYEFTQVLDREFSAEQKKRVVELLWLVAFADGEKDPHEEQLVRRIAGLLHVPHPDFIDAKIRARGERGALP